ncbi:hypothetical protein C2E21_3152 [Chlorella sorokiniana]|uniref:TOG domain-containing protein n=1 Tax=Chlorella sorokiniana TaxID=3076 RepID=A0A2P6TVR9_CHLSO|nr:hypothetical protein C2E21_3152 [Chlorella sorokiniana]|eukprot:PRW58152.1 hypothetical protein C2E21_3152 [Chlorella sorokiniana]
MPGTSERPAAPLLGRFCGCFGIAPPPRAAMPSATTAKQAPQDVQPAKMAGAPASVEVEAVAAVPACATVAASFSGAAPAAVAEPQETAGQAPPASSEEEAADVAPRCTEPQAEAAQQDEGDELLAAVASAPDAPAPTPATGATEEAQASAAPAAQLEPAVGAQARRGGSKLPRPPSRSSSRPSSAKAAGASASDSGSRPASRASQPGSRQGSRPASRASAAPAAPTTVATALKNLAQAQPVDPVADLNVIRAAAAADKGSLELRKVVPLLVRLMRAPRLGTARAATLTLKDLLVAFGDEIAVHISDDTAPTTCAVLGLLQKATGGDLNSRRIAGDANACLIALAESLSPVQAIAACENYAYGRGKGSNGHVRSKAAAVVVAAAYKQAASDLAGFDEELMARLLKLTEALLMGGGVACRQVARKLAVVCYSAFANQGPHEPVGPDGEDAWAARLRLCMEPETTQAIHGAIEQYGSAGAAFIGASAADLQGLATGQTPPLGEVVARLVLASD